MVERVRLEVEVVKAIPVPVRPAFLRGLLQRAAQVPEIEARMPASSTTLAIRLTSDDELRRLNRDFAGQDTVTDVLSFGGSDQHLGDLAVSWPMVVRQALEFGESEQTELAVLSVHGLLHLLGWDHGSAAQQKEMTRLTVAVLALSDVQLAPGRL